MRRKLLWAGVVALLLLAVAGLWGIYGTQTVTLTEAQVQERINRQLDRDFPVKGAGHLLVKTVRIQSATVHIQDGHVIALADVEGTLRTNKKFTLTAYAIGVPSYSRGEFFFVANRIEVQKFAYEGSAPTELFARFAKRYVSDEKARVLIEEKAPKVEEWMTAVAQNAVRQTLEHRPVYRLKDDVRGLLIRAALQAVTIDQRGIVITFTLWQLTQSVLIGLLCLIAALILLGVILV